jgi:hypothetical protein
MIVKPVRYFEISLISWHFGKVDITKYALEDAKGRVICHVGTLVDAKEIVKSLNREVL